MKNDKLILKKAKMITLMTQDFCDYVESLNSNAHSDRMLESIFKEFKEMEELYEKQIENPAIVEERIITLFDNDCDENTYVLTNVPEDEIEKAIEYKNNKRLNGDDDYLSDFEIIKEYLNNLSNEYSFNRVKLNRYSW